MDADPTITRLDAMPDNPLHISLPADKEAKRFSSGARRKFGHSTPGKVRKRRITFIQFVTLDCISQFVRQTKYELENTVMDRNYLDPLLSLRLQGYRALTREVTNLKQNVISTISMNDDILVMMENCCSEGLYYVYDASLRCVTISNVYDLDASSFVVEASDLNVGNTSCGYHVNMTRQIIYINGPEINFTEIVDFKIQKVRIDFLTAIKICLLTGKPPLHLTEIKKIPRLKRDEPTYYGATYLNDKEPDEGNVGHCLNYLISPSRAKGSTLSNVRESTKRERVTVPPSGERPSSSSIVNSSAEFEREFLSGKYQLTRTKGTQFAAPLSLDTAVTNVIPIPRESSRSLIRDTSKPPIDPKDVRRDNLMKDLRGKIFKNLRDKEERIIHESSSRDKSDKVRQESKRNNERRQEIKNDNNKDDDPSRDDDNNRTINESENRSRRLPDKLDATDEELNTSDTLSSKFEWDKNEESTEKKLLYFNPIAQDLMRKCIYYNILDDLGHCADAETAMIIMRKTVMSKIYRNWASQEDTTIFLPHPEFFRLAALRDDGIPIMHRLGFLTLTVSNILKTMWNYYLISIPLTKGAIVKIKLCQYENLFSPNDSKFSITSHIKLCALHFGVHHSWFNISLKDSIDDESAMVNTIFRGSEEEILEIFKQDWRNVLAEKMARATQLDPNNISKAALCRMIMSIWKNTKTSEMENYKKKIFDILNLKSQSPDSEFSEITSLLRTSSDIEYRVMGVLTQEISVRLREHSTKAFSAHITKLNALVSKLKCVIPEVDVPLRLEIVQMECSSLISDFWSHYVYFQGIFTEALVLYSMRIKFISEPNKQTVWSYIFELDEYVFQSIFKLSKMEFTKKFKRLKVMLSQKPDSLRVEKTGPDYRLIITEVGVSLSVGEKKQIEETRWSDLIFNESTHNFNVGLELRILLPAGFRTAVLEEMERNGFINNIMIVVGEVITEMKTIDREIKSKKYFSKEMMMPKEMGIAASLPHNRPIQARFAGVGDDVLRFHAEEVSNAISDVTEESFLPEFLKDNFVNQVVKPPSVIDWVDEDNIFEMLDKICNADEISSSINNSTYNNVSSNKNFEASEKAFFLKHNEINYKNSNEEHFEGSKTLHVLSNVNNLISSKVECDCDDEQRSRLSLIIKLINSVSSGTDSQSNDIGKLTDRAVKCMLCLLIRCKGKEVSFLTRHSNVCKVPKYEDFSINDLINEVGDAINKIIESENQNTMDNSEKKKKNLSFCRDYKRIDDRFIALKEMHQTLVTISDKVESETHHLEMHERITILNLEMSNLICWHTRIFIPQSICDEMKIALKFKHELTLKDNIIHRQSQNEKNINKANEEDVKFKACYKFAEKTKSFSLSSEFKELIIHDLKLKFNSCFSSENSESNSKIDDLRQSVFETFISSNFSDESLAQFVISEIVSKTFSSESTHSSIRVKTMLSNNWEAWIYKRKSEYSNYSVILRDNRTGATTPPFIFKQEDKLSGINSLNYAASWFQLACTELHLLELNKPLNLKKILCEEKICAQELETVLNVIHQSVFIENDMEVAIGAIDLLKSSFKSMKKDSKIAMCLAMTHCVIYPQIHENNKSLNAVTQALRFCIWGTTATFFDHKKFMPKLAGLIRSPWSQLMYSLNAACGFYMLKKKPDLYLLKGNLKKQLDCCFEVMTSPYIFFSNSNSVTSALTCTYICHNFDRFKDSNSNVPTAKSWTAMTQPDKEHKELWKTMPLSEPCGKCVTEIKREGLLKSNTACSNCIDTALYWELKTGLLILKRETHEMVRYSLYQQLRFCSTSTHKTRLTVPFLARYMQELRARDVGKEKRSSNYQNFNKNYGVYDLCNTTKTMVGGGDSIDSERVQDRYKINLATKLSNSTYKTRKATGAGSQSQLSKEELEEVIDAISNIEMKELIRKEMTARNKIDIKQTDFSSVTHRDPEKESKELVFNVEDFFNYIKNIRDNLKIQDSNISRSLLELKGMINECYRSSHQITKGNEEAAAQESYESIKITKVNLVNNIWNNTPQDESIKIRKEKNLKDSAILIEPNTFRGAVGQEDDEIDEINRKRLINQRKKLIKQKKRQNLAPKIKSYSVAEKMMKLISDNSIPTITATLNNVSQEIVKLLKTNKNSILSIKSQHYITEFCQKCENFLNEIKDMSEERWNQTDLSSDDDIKALLRKIARFNNEHSNIILAHFFEIISISCNYDLCWFFSPELSSKLLSSEMFESWGEFAEKNLKNHIKITPGHLWAVNVILKQLEFRTTLRATKPPKYKTTRDEIFATTVCYNNVDAIRTCLIALVYNRVDPVVMSEKLGRNSGASNYLVTSRREVIMFVLHKIFKERGASGLNIAQKIAESKEDCYKIATAEKAQFGGERELVILNTDFLFVLKTAEFLAQSLSKCSEHDMMQNSLRKKEDLALFQDKANESSDNEYMRVNAVSDDCTAWGPTQDTLLHIWNLHSLIGDIDKEMYNLASIGLVRLKTKKVFLGNPVVDRIMKGLINRNISIKKIYPEQTKSLNEQQEREKIGLPVQFGLYRKLKDSSGRMIETKISIDECNMPPDTLLPLSCILNGKDYATMVNHMCQGIPHANSSSEKETQAHFNKKFSMWQAKTNNFEIEYREHNSSDDSDVISNINIKDSSAKTIISMFDVDPIIKHLRYLKAEKGANEKIISKWFKEDKCKLAADIMFRRQQTVATITQLCRSVKRSAKSMTSTLQLEVYSSWGTVRGQGNPVIKSTTACINSTTGCTFLEENISNITLTNDIGQKGGDYLTCVFNKSLRNLRTLTIMPDAASKLSNELTLSLYHKLSTKFKLSDLINDPATIIDHSVMKVLDDVTERLSRPNFGPSSLDNGHFLTLGMKISELVEVTIEGVYTANVVDSSSLLYGTQFRRSPPRSYRKGLEQLADLREEVICENEKERFFLQTLYSNRKISTETTEAAKFTSSAFSKNIWRSLVNLKSFDTLNQMRLSTLTNVLYKGPYLKSVNKALSYDDCCRYIDLPNLKPATTDAEEIFNQANKMKALINKVTKREDDLTTMMDIIEKNVNLKKREKVSDREGYTETFYKNNPMKIVASRPAEFVTWWVCPQVLSSSGIESSYAELIEDQKKVRNTNEILSNLLDEIKEQIEDAISLNKEQISTINFVIRMMNRNPSVVTDVFVQKLPHAKKKEGRMDLIMSKIMTGVHFGINEFECTGSNINYTLNSSEVWKMACSYLSNLGLGDSDLLASYKKVMKLYYEDGKNLEDEAEKVAGENGLYHLKSMIKRCRNFIKHGDDTSNRVVSEDSITRSVKVENNSAMIYLEFSNSCCFCFISTDEDDYDKKSIRILSNRGASIVHSMIIHIINMTKDKYSMPRKFEIKDVREFMISLIQEGDETLMIDSANNFTLTFEESCIIKKYRKLLNLTAPTDGTFSNVFLTKKSKIKSNNAGLSFGYEFQGTLLMDAYEEINASLLKNKELSAIVRETKNICLWKPIVYIRSQYEVSKLVAERIEAVLAMSYNTINRYSHKETSIKIDNVIDIFVMSKERILESYDIDTQTATVSTKFLRHKGSPDKSIPSSPTSYKFLRFLSQFFDENFSILSTDAKNFHLNWFIKTQHPEIHSEIVKEAVKCRQKIIELSKKFESTDNKTAYDDNFMLNDDVTVHLSKDQRIDQYSITGSIDSLRYISSLLQCVVKTLKNTDCESSRLTTQMKKMSTGKYTGRVVLSVESKGLKQVVDTILILATKQLENPYRYEVNKLLSFMLNILLFDKISVKTFENYFNMIKASNDLFKTSWARKCESGLKDVIGEDDSEEFVDKLNEVSSRNITIVRTMIGDIINLARTESLDAANELITTLKATFGERGNHETNKVSLKDLLTLTGKCADDNIGLVRKEEAMEDFEAHMRRYRNQRKKEKRIARESLMDKRRELRDKFKNGEYPEMTDGELSFKMQKLIDDFNDDFNDVNSESEEGEDDESVEPQSENDSNYTIEDSESIENPEHYAFELNPGKFKL